jgi:hypothetical protein
MWLGRKEQRQWKEVRMEAGGCLERTYFVSTIRAVSKDLRYIPEDSK